MESPQEKAKEALRLNNRAIRLTRYQIFHMYTLLVVITIPLFAQSDAVTYGAWAICVAVIIHDRLTAREIKSLQKRVDTLKREAEGGKPEEPH
jgi:hypothetical protein